MGSRERFEAAHDPVAAKRFQLRGEHLLFDARQRVPQFGERMGILRKQVQDTRFPFAGHDFEDRFHRARIQGLAFWLIGHGHNVLCLGGCVIFPHNGN